MRFLTSFFSRISLKVFRLHLGVPVSGYTIRLLTYPLKSSLQFHKFGSLRSSLCNHINYLKTVHTLTNSFKLNNLKNPRDTKHNFYSKHPRYTFFEFFDSFDCWTTFFQSLYTTTLSPNILYFFLNNHNNPN